MDGELAPGHALARGVARLLRSLDLAPLTEFVPARGLRVDVIAVGPDGEIWIVECKSSRADYTSDAKWQGYLPYCDRFFFAVPEGFPDAILPPEPGLIRADPYGAALLRDAPATPLAPARRKALTRKLARDAALRLQVARDPVAL